ncbi:hypothetical protein TCE0_042r15154 [Talaromyces pinophilus]|uniref:Zn(2)-C6 fungal-type domain-containing protein n=1 Tax=Talaromyces pinophilus TaxID=128442 RepID=A0A6V8HIW1_TALPI|nr:hypothetical protein TCE0_042r15154 [Talaromyces pinophilus]
MPNVGRPSRDCHTCRKRRLKCDLVRPECTQCLRKGLSCPGYRDEMDMRIRMSSASTFQVTDRVRRKTKPREQKTDSEALLEFDVTQTTLERREQMSSKQLFPLANPMTESWDVHCLPFAISKLQLIYVMGPSVFDTALNFFEKMEETSHLYLVCRAIGSAFLANMTKTPKAIMGQAKAYSTSLGAVNKAIRDSKEVTSDDLFLSICLLAFYEVVSGANSGNKSFLVESPGYKAHTKALIDLMCLRGSDMCATRDARNLIGMTHCHLQTQFLLDNVPIQGPPPFLHEFFRLCDPSEWPILRTYVFSFHCTHLCHRIRNLIEGDNAAELLASSSDIIQAIDEVEQQVEPFPEKGPIASIRIDPPSQLLKNDADLSSEELKLRTHQYVIRILLSSYAVDFVSYASRIPTCTAEQRKDFKILKQRYIWEMNVLSKRLPTFTQMPLDMSSLFTESVPRERNGETEVQLVITKSNHGMQFPDSGNGLSSQSFCKSPDMIWKGLLVLAGCDTSALG